MKNQQLSLGLSLVLVLSSSLVIASNRANASPFQSLGTNAESSGFSGDSFVPGGLGTPSQPNLLPGLNVEINPRGKIIVSEDVQNRLNSIANDINSQTPAPNTFAAAVYAVLTGGVGAEEGKLQIQSTLESYTVSPELAKAYIASISGLLANGNVDITQLNSAINNWNNIVKQLNPSDLPKLANNPDFRKLASNLKRLRAALKKPR